MASFDTNTLGLAEYWSHLYETNDQNFGKVVDIVGSQGFLVHTPSHFKGTSFEERIVRIVYVDYNRLWRYKWAREARGTILYLNDENQWVYFKYALQRGAEVLTSLQMAHGISATQDVDDMNSLAIFDDRQQEVMRSLRNEETIEGTLSSKVDGSLLTLTCFRGRYAETVCQFIDEFGDEFSKTVKDLAVQSGADFVPVFSSQTTFFAPDFMQPFYTTALLDSTGIVPFDELSRRSRLGESPSQILQCPCVGTELLRRLQLLVRGSRDIDVATYSFEAVCRNRASAWGDRHTELAVSYPVSMIRPLGVSLCRGTALSWRPHFTFAQDIAEAGFSEPLYWHVTHTRDIERIMTSLSECIRGRRSVEAFLELFPPSNTHPTEKYIDWEGFVFLTDPDFMYSKIKTEEYYNCHKFRPQNIGYLMELAPHAGHIFPLARVVSNFFASLIENLMGLLTELHQILKSPPRALLVECFGSDEQSKVWRAYQSRDLDVQNKMIVNAGSGYPFAVHCHPIFKKYFCDFPDFVADAPPPTALTRESESTGHLPEDCVGLMRRLVMTFEVWDMTSTHRRVEEAVNAVSFVTQNPLLQGDETQADTSAAVADSITSKRKKLSKEAQTVEKLADIVREIFNLHCKTIS